MRGSWGDGRYHQVRPTLACCLFLPLEFSTSQGLPPLPTTASLSVLCISGSHCTRTLLFSSSWPAFAQVLPAARQDQAPGNISLDQGAGSGSGGAADSGCAGHAARAAVPAGLTHHSEASMLAELVGSSAPVLQPAEHALSWPVTLDIVIQHLCCAHHCRPTSHAPNLPARPSKLCRICIAANMPLKQTPASMLPPYNLTRTPVCRASGRCSVGPQ